MKSLLLCFTFDVTLKNWNDKGFLVRELKYYESLSKRLNLEICFLTYGGKNDYKFIPHNSSIKIIPIFENIQKSKFKILNLFKSIFFIIKYNKKIESFDYYKSNQNYGSWIAAFLKFKYKKKFISRGGYDLFHFSLYKKNIFKIIVSYLICFIAYKSADIVYVPTVFYKKFIQKYFFISKNVHILPNFVDTEIFKVDKSRRYKLKLLFVGRLVKQKNIFNIINSLSDSKYELDILGQGPLKSKIINYANRKNVKIKFLKNISNNLMPRLYSKYNFLILLSKYEGNPKVILEAMSCGVCVLGANTTGISDILNNKNGLLIYLNHQKFIVKTIDKLLYSDTLKHIQNNARNYIIDNHSINKILDKEMYFFNKIKFN